MTMLIMNLFAGFSLALALSLRKRKQFLIGLRSSRAARFADRLAVILPLLGGEGRGEGGRQTL